MGNQWPAVRQADYGLGAVPWQLKLSQWFRGQESESLCGSAFVSMVKPAHLGHGNNPSPLGRFNRSSVRRVLPKRKMTTRTVIVVQVAGHLPPERGFIHHDDLIQAFAANGTDQPFDIWALPRRAWRREHFRDVHLGSQRPEGLAVHSIPVPKRSAAQRPKGMPASAAPPSTLQSDVRSH